MSTASLRAREHAHARSSPGAGVELGHGASLSSVSWCSSPLVVAAQANRTFTLHTAELYSQWVQHVLLLGPSPPSQLFHRPNWRSAPSNQPPLLIPLPGLAAPTHLLWLWVRVESPAPGLWCLASFPVFPVQGHSRCAMRQVPLLSKTTSRVCVGRPLVACYLSVRLLCV